MSKPVRKPSSSLSDQHVKSCIWMTAGVISYKLCPLNFNCEACEFDAAMQSERKGAEWPGGDQTPGRAQL